MNVMTEAAAAPARLIRTAAKKKAVKKKKVPATPARPAAGSAEQPKGIGFYNGKFEVAVFFGVFATLKEPVAMREKVLEFKRSLKPEAPAAVAAPAKKKKQVHHG